jgi:tetratricopeptide (TPR) repeat protein
MRVFMALALTAAVIAMLPRTLHAEQSEARSRCLAREGPSIEQKLDACTAVIESGQETSRGLVAIYNARGNAYLGNRDYDHAIDDYGEATRLDPKFAIGFHNRGLGYHRKSQYDRAIQDYDEAIRLNPKYASAFANRASAQRSRGRLDLAVADADQAIALDPNLTFAFFVRALAYHDKALWDFEAYLNEGLYEDRAIQDYDEVIRRDPNNAAAFRNRGSLHLRMRRYDRAIADFDEAIRLDATVAGTFASRGYALRFTGQYDRALADYRKALTLKLDDTTRRQIERTLKQLGAGFSKTVIGE